MNSTTSTTQVTAHVTFTKPSKTRYTDPTVQILMDGKVVGEIECRMEECWDGIRRVTDYVVLLLTPTDAPEDFDDNEEFAVRGCHGENKPLEGVTANGQLAAAKRWAKAQLAKLSK
jgi:hypothetical protein